MIKAASIGLGWWSDELAKSIQGKSKKIKIVSCYSRSKKKRINFSKKYKKILSVGHNRRYSSVSDFINNLNRQKRIGKILHIEANYSASGA